MRSFLKQRVQDKPTRNYSTVVSTPTTKVACRFLRDLGPSQETKARGHLLDLTI